MPVHDFKQSFNAGELSPFMDSRVAVEKYQAGCSVMENMIPQPHGPAIKRAGTVYLAAQDDTSNYGRVIGLSFSLGAYCVLEFTDSGLRTWESSTPGSSGAGPYAADDLEGVKFSHINNLAWFAHPDYPVHRLTRNAASNYSFDDMDAGIVGVGWDYPPLLDENVSTTTMAISAVTAGAGRTLTASANYFTSANVGSYFEIAHPRTTTFADVLLGDSAVKAFGILTITGKPADGDTITVAEIINGAAVSRVYTVRTAGRDAIDEIATSDADEFADNLILAINNGGGGAEPHKSVEAEEIGGLKAVGYFGNTTGTNVSDNDTVTIGDFIYTFDNVGTWQEDAYVVRQGATLQESLTNLKKCINLSPLNPETPEYWRNVPQGDDPVAHPDVEAVEVLVATSGYKLTVQARQTGPKGNVIPTTDASANASWDAATLSGGSRVIRIVARESGTGGNAISASESASNVAWSGLSGGFLANGADDSSATSTSLIVLGKYEVRSTGRWNGSVFLEKERGIGSTTWDVIRTWKSVNDYNILETGEFLVRTSLRLRFVGSGTEIDQAFPRAILTPTDAFVRGLVKVTAYTSATVVTVTVINELLSTAATPAWSEGAWSPRRGYPRATCFYQNRLWFGGTAYEPSKIWGSALGDFENFRITSLDDGAVAFQIAASEALEIVWLAVSHALVIGTTGGIWIGEPADGQIAITNTNPPQFRQKGGRGMGCADEQPVMLQDALVYITKGWRQIRRISYDENRVFSTALLTVLADHVPGVRIDSLAATGSPDNQLWAIRTDRNAVVQLVCLTFDSEQNVFAWSRHPMSNGNPESLTVISSSFEDELWMTCSRNSSRTVERMDPATGNRRNSSLDRYVYVDSAVVKSASSFTTVAGLSHLNGLEVIAYTTSLFGARTQPAMSGATQAKYTVSGGEITLSEAALSAVVGLPIEAQITPMKPEIALRDGSSRDRVIKVVGLTLGVKDAADSVLIFQGSTQSSAPLVDVVECETQGPPVTKQLPVKRLTTRHSQDGLVSVRHIGAGPFTLTGMVTQIDVGGASTNHPPGS